MRQPECPYCIENLDETKTYLFCPLCDTKFFVFVSNTKQVYLKERNNNLSIILGEV